MKDIKMDIAHDAQITERGIKLLIAKRGINKAVEATAVYNHWDNCTTIDVRTEGNREFGYRFHKSNSGKITKHPFF